MNRLALELIRGRVIVDEAVVLSKSHWAIKALTITISLRVTVIEVFFHKIFKFTIM